MIVKDHGLVDISYQGDNSTFTHMQNKLPTLWEIQQLKSQGTDGFNQSRTQQHVGRIPALEFVKHPEWAYDTSLILKWLKSDEGKQYQVHKVDTGRSGKCIVK